MNPILEHRNFVASQIEKSFGEEIDIEKAHDVGDVHPNGKWVWTEYAPGKFDWRNKKKDDGKQAKDFEEHNEREITKKNNSVKLKVENPDYCGHQYIVKKKDGGDVDIQMYYKGNNRTGQANTLSIGINNQTAKIFGFENSVKLTHAFLDFCRNEKIKRGLVKISGTKLSSAANVVVNSFTVSKLRRMMKYFNENSDNYNKLSHNNDTNVYNYLNLAELFNPN